MSTQATPAQMVAAFTKWHCDLRLFPGYATRGYGPGSISDVEGVMIHHTGSDAQSDAYLDFLFNIGRPGDVPPPLCNWATDMDGDLWLGAAERANHAGAGSSATVSKVVTGNYDWRNATLKPGVDDINGNSRYYGNEVRFDGGQPMTRAQWVTVILSSAAMCDFHGWGAWHVIGHKEHTGRKTDPASTLMYMIRRDVAAALTAGPGNWPTEEWDMATGDEVLARVNLLITAEANRYQRYEELFAQILAALKAQSAAMTAQDAGDDAALRTAMDALSNSISQLETETAAAGRYSHVISTLTEWAEGRDEIRQDELLAKLNELLPAEPPPAEPTLPKA